MNTFSYQQFIEELNEGKIIKALFKVKDYTHYKCCIIERKVDVLENGNCLVYIEVKLTKDSEHISFYKTFKENHKLFYMGRKGTFTLKQMWDRIEFISIDYAA